MPLEAKLVDHLHKSLAAADEQGSGGSRLVEEARRMWRRVQKFVLLALGSANRLDLDGLELACYALQFPQRQSRAGPGGKAGRSTTRQRAEDAIEMLIRVAGKAAPEELLERSARILREMHHRSPMLDEARVLADAVALDDFGIVGLLGIAVQTGRKGGAVAEVAASIDKRVQYGYWEARVKEGFHFEPIRQVARGRLENARKAAEMLRAEMNEDTQ